MPRYLIWFDAHAMDHIPDEDMPAVTNASLAVVQEAINAGVWVFGGGLENQKASIVATDGTVTDGPYPEAIGGLCVVDVPSREEALEWAAKTAVACRCAQEVPGVHARPDHRQLDDTSLGERTAAWEVVRDKDNSVVTGPTTGSAPIVAAPVEVSERDVSAPFYEGGTGDSTGPQVEHESQRPHGSTEPNPHGCSGANGPGVEPGTRDRRTMSRCLDRDGKKRMAIRTW